MSLPKIVMGPPIRPGEQSTSSIETIFSTLDIWRHLPAYQLERRADLFFGMFLPKVLAREYNRCESGIRVIPEFPLHKKTLGIGEHNDSLKVDFAAFSGNSQAFLIELKTDMNSIDEKQKCNLLKAKKAGLGRLLQGIIEICKSDGVKNSAPKSKKYAHLMFQLEELGFVELDNEYKKKVFAYDRTGLKAALDLNKVSSLCNDERGIEVVFIQPQPIMQQADQCRVIDFDKFASHIKEDDGLGKMFARYLDKWKKQAGERNPWCKTTPTVT